MSGPERKNQVSLVNSLLDDVEGVRQKLHVLSDLKSHSQISPNSSSTSPSPSSSSSSSTSSSTAKSKTRKRDTSSITPIPVELPTKRMKVTSEEKDKTACGRHIRSLSDAEGWRKLILRPRMNLHHYSKMYTISAFIPGMRKDDIKIVPNVTKSVVTISGFRAPTKEEIQDLSELCGRYTVDVENLDDEQFMTLLLRIGAGKNSHFY